MTVVESSILPKGIYSPIPTYYKNDGKFSLDTETQVKHALMLYDNGINGLVVSGSMGESTNISPAERNSALRSLRKAIPDRKFKLIAGMPPNSIAEVITESEESKKNGADFIILLVPGYFGPNLVSQQGITDYFLNIADYSALPIVIYNYPGTCNNVNITIDTFEALSKHENIVAVKLTHFNLDVYTLLGNNKTYETNNFRPFTGLGQVLIPSLSVGMFGAIDGLSGIFPKSMLKLMKLYEDGEKEKALQLQYIITKVDLMISELNVVGVKQLLKEVHGFGEILTGRPPLSKPVDLDAYKKYEIDIKKLAEVEKSL
ncbi:unnamed protein product [Debaryomyces tyrocola]|nr:unnamed protein product [Debaryomyces tyrocola]